VSIAGSLFCQVRSKKVRSILGYLISIGIGGVQI
jgi:hypothetical protein